MVDIASYKQKIEDKINSLTTSDSVASHMEILKAIRGVGGVVTVSSVNDLPEAADHEGSLYMVYSSGDTANFYTSNGTSWILITIDPSINGYELYQGLYDNYSLFTTSASRPIQEPLRNTQWSSLGRTYDNNNFYALKTDGTLWIWGLDTRNFLSGTSPAYSPVQDYTSSTWKPGTISSVASSSQHFGAGIKTDGTLWTWGANNKGQLGTGNITNTSSPVQEITSSTNWTSVIVGGTGSSDGYIIATKADGTLWGWGHNQYGNLGTDDVVSYSSPVQEVSSSTDWDTRPERIAAGKYFTLARKSGTAGSYYAWGLNNYGQLGTNNTTCYSSPVLVNGADWEECLTIQECSALIHGPTRRLFTFGGTQNGCLMQNNGTQNISSPTQEITGSSWKKISGSNANFAGIKNDGTLWLAGGGGSGALLNDYTDIVSQPVQELSLSDKWTDVSMAKNGPVMLKDIE